jgi:uncharacterized protein YjbJ (UPF0337 family)
MMDNNHAWHPICVSQFVALDEADNRRSIDSSRLQLPKLIGDNPMQKAQSPTRQKWEGRWDQLTGKAKSLWGNLTDDDVLKAKGDYEQLVGQIKTRTGKTREEIEKALES